LIAALRDERREVRYIAAQELARRADRLAAPALIAALEDPYLLVRFEAARALRAIGTPEAEAAVARWEAARISRDQRKP